MSRDFAILQLWWPRASKPQNLTRMKFSYFLNLLLLLTITTFFACDDDEPTAEPPVATITTAEELTEALHDAYDNTDAPGFAVTVVENNEVVYQEAFGQADMAANRAYTNTTVQPIGSISKTFIAAAVVKAIEDGYFSLDNDINEILPFEVVNPKQPDATIRVKDLVTHTSGLVDEGDIYLQAYRILPGESTSSEGADVLFSIGVEQREGQSLHDFLSSYYLPGGASYSEDNFAATAPGNTWDYSNIASSLAAYVVEVATNTPYDQYLKENVLQPLGMANATFDWTEVAPTEAAVMYWEKDSPFPVYSNDSYPDGSLIVSNEDMGKYMLDMVRGVSGQSTTLFSQAAYQLLFGGLLSEGVTPAHLSENQGVFWSLDGSTIFHTGGDPGIATFLSFDRLTQSGIYIATNMDASTNPHQAAYEAFLQEVISPVVSFMENN